jgi:hypothetical protein
MAIQQYMKAPFSRLVGIVLLFTSALTRMFAGPGDEHWSYQFGWPGTLENVNAIRIHQGKLYFAGGITAGTNATVNVWDGIQFTRFGEFRGGSGTTIYDLLFVGNTLYAAGFFTNVDGAAVRGLARWDGSTWSGIGVTNGTVVALATDGTDLYAGGVFTNPGGAALTNIGRWDGSAWHAIGPGLGGTNTTLNDVVRAILITNGVIYAAGNFSNAGTQALSHIALWNGVNWLPVGGGISGTTVYGLAWQGSSLYAAGIFSQAGGTPANNVARWDGANWFALNAGISGGAAVSIASFNNLICVAGNFTSADGSPAASFAVWDGANWSDAGANLTALAFRVYSTGTNIYLGGNFLGAAYQVMAGLASWNGTRWSVIGPAGKIAGLSSSVRALASDGSNIIAGGTFTLAGQTNAAHVGRYDGTNWHTFGTGLNDDVKQLALVGTNLYGAGDFTGGAGGPFAGKLARWNGAQWLPLNNTAFNNITSLAVRDTDLFVGGFSGINAANGTANDIARWDGTNFWKFLAFDQNTFVAFPFPGTNVTGIGTQGTNIYIAGNFRITQCDSNLQNCIECSNIMRFDGTFARNVGQGLNGQASSVLVMGTNVYFAGNFTTAFPIGGSIVANRIARWNGVTWSQVGGPGVVGTGTINALGAIGTNLYAGGTFTNIGGVRANRIAKWDGTSWSPLGSGTVFSATSGTVLSLLALGQDLYVGGTFRTAGDKPSYYLARWNEQKNFEPAILRFTNPGKSSGGSFQATITASNALSYIIESSTNLSTWNPVLTNTSTPFLFIDSNAPPAARRFYRANSPL